MNLLLVAFNFPPDPAIGAVRVGALANELRSAGHQVDVLTAVGPGSNGEPGIVRAKWFDTRRMRMASELNNTDRSAPTGGSALTHNEPTRTGERGRAHPMTRAARRSISAMIELGVARDVRSRPPDLRPSNSPIAQLDGYPTRSALAFAATQNPPTTSSSRADRHFPHS